MSRSPKLQSKSERATQHRPVEDCEPQVARRVLAIFNRTRHLARGARVWSGLYWESGWLGNMVRGQMGTRGMLWVVVETRSDCAVWFGDGEYQLENRSP